MTKQAALEDLICSLYSDSELKIFLRRLPDGKRFVDGLPNNASLGSIASELVALLSRRGQVNNTFFHSLIDFAPNRTTDIEKVAAEWGLRNPSLATPSTRTSPTSTMPASSSTPAARKVMPRPAKAFISYSHADEVHRQKLETHLKLLRRQGLLTTWHDRQINLGTEWDQTIANELNSADLIFLMITADFLASDYLWDKEVARAMERHNAGEAVVVPIFVRPCDWKNAPFGELQGVPNDAKAVTTWDNEDEAWTEIARRIRSVLL